MIPQTLRIFLHVNNAFDAECYDTINLKYHLDLFVLLVKVKSWSLEEYHRKIFFVFFSWIRIKWSDLDPVSQPCELECVLHKISIEGNEIVIRMILYNIFLFYFPILKQGNYIHPMWKIALSGFYELFVFLYWYTSVSTSESNKRSNYWIPPNYYPN